MPPIVTIALPVYNGAATLKLAVRSNLQQSFTDWELIILNDASTDNSLEVMRSFDDPRIHMIEGEENLGLSARLNMAVDMARGQYFARMDQDDVSLPQRIEKQLGYLLAHPEVDLLATNYAVFNDSLEWLGKLSVSQLHYEICRKPWSGFFLPHPTWMGKLDWFQNHRYQSYADGAEDQNLLLRSYNESCFACLDEVLLAYRQNARPLKKVLRARFRYIKSAYISFGFGDANHMAVKVFIVQLAKGLGDIINAYYKVFGFQRKLLPLQDEEKRYLNLVYKGL